MDIYTTTGARTAQPGLDAWLGRGTSPPVGLRHIWRFNVRLLVEFLKNRCFWNASEKNEKNVFFRKNVLFFLEIGKMGKIGRVHG